MSKQVLRALIQSPNLNASELGGTVTMCPKALVSALGLSDQMVIAVRLSLHAACNKCSETCFVGRIYVFYAERPSAECKKDVLDLLSRPEGYFDTQIVYV